MFVYKDIQLEPLEMWYTLISIIYDENIFLALPNVQDKKYVCCIHKRENAVFKRRRLCHICIIQISRIVLCKLSNYMYVRLWEKKKVLIEKRSIKFAKQGTLFPKYVNIDDINELWKKMMKITILKFQNLNFKETPNSREKHKEMVF